MVCIVCGQDVPLENLQLWHHIQKHNREGASIRFTPPKEDPCRS